MAVALTATALACTSTDAEQSSPIRLNQLGELPDGVKIAITPDDSKQPLEWSLIGADGRVVARGKTVPFGPDRYSGESAIASTSVHSPRAGLDFDCGPETR